VSSGQAAHDACIFSHHDGPSGNENAPSRHIFHRLLTLLAAAL